MSRVTLGRVIWIAVAAVLFLAFFGVTYVAGGGSAPSWLWFLKPTMTDPVEASVPAEQVLRSMRLAGVEYATVGEQNQRVVLRMEIPQVNTPADVELMWQAGIGSMTVAYPRAAEYCVQLFSVDAPLLEVRVDGGVARTAAQGGEGLREGMRFAYLATTRVTSTADPGVRSESAETTPGLLGYIARGLRGDPWHVHAPGPVTRSARARALAQAAPAGAAAVPLAAVSIDLDVPAEYLDAKNRAAGFVDEEARLQGAASGLAPSAQRSRSRVPGVPALPPGADAGEFWAKRSLAKLAASSGDSAQADRLASALRDVRAGDLAPVQVELVRAIAMTVTAVESDGFGSVTDKAAALASDVAQVPLAHGAASDAVLAAAQSPRAVKDAVDIARFTRVQGLDRFPEEPRADDRIGAALAASGVDGLTYVTVDDEVSLTPSRWLAFRRPDGTVFYRAGTDGASAVFDASIAGWAFVAPRIDVVRADNVGVVLGSLDGAAR